MRSKKQISVASQRKCRTKLSLQRQILFVKKMHGLCNFKLRSSTPKLIKLLREHPSWNIRPQTVLNDREPAWFISHVAAQTVLCVAYLLRQDSLPNSRSGVQRIQSPTSHSKQNGAALLPKSGNYTSISGSIFLAFFTQRN